MLEGTYGADLKFLDRHTAVIELTAPRGARVVIAPEYQARAMTSTLGGMKGMSFGWINKDFIASRRHDERFNNYGGEDRLWLGPEAGQFGLWFAKGVPFDLDHWKVPLALNTGAFEVVSRERDCVTMIREFQVTNYSGTNFRCKLERAIRLLVGDSPVGALGVTTPHDVKMVGFESHNMLTNTGDEDWTRSGGLLSIWTLGMFKPLPRGSVIVPFAYGDEKTLGAKVAADYFGPIPKDRCRVSDDHLVFSCDGKFRSKIGVSPLRAKDVLGSYDPDSRVLTIVQFNLPLGAGQMPYVNSLWEIQDDPYSGDVVNSYNDGEPTPGAGQLGPFYELETSSPAADLKPGESITHIHRTFHFAGAFDVLDELGTKILGVDVGEISPSEHQAPDRARKKRSTALIG